MAPRLPLCIIGYYAYQPPPCFCRDLGAAADSRRRCGAAPLAHRHLATRLSLRRVLRGAGGLAHPHRTCLQADLPHRQLRRGAAQLLRQRRDVLAIRALWRRGRTYRHAHHRGGLRHPGGAGGLRAGRRDAWVGTEPLAGLSPAGGGGPGRHALAHSLQPHWHRTDHRTVGVGHGHLAVIARLAYRQWMELRRLRRSHSRLDVYLPGRLGHPLSDGCQRLAVVAVYASATKPQPAWRVDDQERCDPR